MVDVQQVTPADVDRWARLRLRALLDAPSAFGSTHAAVSQWSDVDWEQRIAQLCGGRQAGFLARDGNDDVGMAAGALDDDDPTRAALISMWVAPTHRRLGVGGMIVNHVLEWARTQRVGVVRLTVTSSNHAAIRFYGRLGFTMTGRTEPYPNDPDLVELEMERAV